MEKGLPYGPDPEDETAQPTIEELASEQIRDAELARKLSKAIKRVATDMKEPKHKRYSYEKWVEFTRLIRFTAPDVEEHEEAEDMLERDWIGADSPMMVNKSEAEFVLDRLCESLSRYVNRRDKTGAPAGGQQQNLAEAGDSHDGGRGSAPDCEIAG